MLNSKTFKKMMFENLNIKHEGLTETRDQVTYIQDSCVEHVTNTMYLGVNIDVKLTFTNHTSRMLY